VIDNYRDDHDNFVCSLSR